MKYLPLIWAGLWRRPARSIFTLLSVAVAFFLFGILQGLNDGFDKALADQHLDRLITDRKVPGAPPMPISALEQIEKIPGVTRVAQRATLMGTYREPKNMVAAGYRSTALLQRPAGIPDRARTVRRAEVNAHGPGGDTGAGAVLRMESRRQDLNQVANLQRDGSDVWTFDIVGPSTPGEPGKFYLSLMNYQYLDEARAHGQGDVERFIVRIADPGRSVATAAAIDRLFANSQHETRTRSEKEMALVRMKQVGDIRYITRAIVGAVLFTLLFLTANTMRQSVRDRTSEFGVLKSIGMSEAPILWLILAEAGVLCVIAAAMGLALAAAGAPLRRDTIGSPHRCRVLDDSRRNCLPRCLAAQSCPPCGSGD